MTTLRDLLLELRAIRIGFQYQLYLTTGKTIDLMADAQRQETELTRPERRKPRDPDAIIHRNSDHLIRQQRLRESGDDTNRMIEQIRQTFGDEKADQLRQFYEKEIIGKQ